MALDFEEIGWKLGYPTWWLRLADLRDTSRPPHSPCEACGGLIYHVRFHQWVCSNCHPVEGTTSLGAVMDWILGAEADPGSGLALPPFRVGGEPPASVLVIAQIAPLSPEVLVGERLEAMEAPLPESVRPWVEGPAPTGAEIEELRAIVEWNRSLRPSERERESATKKGEPWLTGTERKGEWWDEEERSSDRTVDEGDAPGTGDLS